VRALDAAGVTTYVELGPDAVLTAMAQQTTETATFVPTLRRDRDEVRELVTAVALMHCQGVAVDWAAFYAGTGARRVDLPTYAFQRRPYWLAEVTGETVVIGGSTSSLVDQPDVAAGTKRWQGILAQPGGERDRAALTFVRQHVATVLGHEILDEVEPDRAFTELGFDSVAASELRKRLATATGAELPATLAFDHPNARAVTDLLLALREEADESPAQSVIAELDRLEAVLSAAPELNGDTSRVTARLEAVLRSWRDARQGAVADVPDDFASATDDELFQTLDNLEIGS
ncbi:phosphopantetheine-binding protein, partial [Streptomyces sp. NPDC045431]|uniref:phosphopantetheine-binding protein n=1 Tax=Streptomyces sp. NPDC045431 TaxID=3155613 RepID=UPI0034060DE4